MDTRSGCAGIELSALRILTDPLQVFVMASYQVCVARGQVLAPCVVCSLVRVDMNGMLCALPHCVVVDGRSHARGWLRTGGRVEGCGLSWGLLLPPPRTPSSVG